MVRAPVPVAGRSREFELPRRSGPRRRLVSGEACLASTGTVEAHDDRRSLFLKGACAYLLCTKDFEMKRRVIVDLSSEPRGDPALASSLGRLPHLPPIPPPLLSRREASSRRDWAWAVGTSRCRSGGRGRSIIRGDAACDARGKDAKRKRRQATTGQGSEGGRMAAGAGAPGEGKRPTGGWTSGRRMGC